MCVCVCTYVCVCLSYTSLSLSLFLGHFVCAECGHMWFSNNACRGLAQACTAGTPRMCTCDKEESFPVGMPRMCVCMYVCMCVCVYVLVVRMCYGRYAPYVGMPRMWVCPACGYAPYVCLYVLVVRMCMYVFMYVCIHIPYWRFCHVQNFGRSAAPTNVSQLDTHTHSHSHHHLRAYTCTHIHRWLQRLPASFGDTPAQNHQARPCTPLLPPSPPPAFHSRRCRRTPLWYICVPNVFLMCS